MLILNVADKFTNNECPLNHLRKMLIVARVEKVLIFFYLWKKCFNILEQLFNALNITNGKQSLQIK